MRDDYYNHMLTSLLADLKAMVTINEPKTMTQLKTMDVKAWEKTNVLVEGLYAYESNVPDKLIEFYKYQLYPIISSGTIYKKGFHKYYAIRIDDFDFRMLISNCEKLIF